MHRTTGISTKHTLQRPEGDKVVNEPGGYLHVREQNEKWEFFVPQSKRHLELCFSKYLPDALVKLMKVDPQIAPQAATVICDVLRSSLTVMDDMLDLAGIGQFSKIEVPPRVISENVELLGNIVLDGAGPRPETLENHSSRPSDMLIRSGSHVRTRESQ